MLTLTKDGERFKIAHGEHSLEFGKTKYEDLYYAVPPEEGKYLATTYLFRLFVDTVCESQEQRDAINAMLDATGDREAALNALQDEIKKVEP